MRARVNLLRYTHCKGNFCNATACKDLSTREVQLAQFRNCSSQNFCSVFLLSGEKGEVLPGEVPEEEEEGGLRVLESGVEEELSAPPLRERLNSFKLCLPREEEEEASSGEIWGSLLFLPRPMILRRLAERCKTGERVEEEELLLLLLPLLLRLVVDVADASSWEDEVDEKV